MADRGTIHVSAPLSNIANGYLQGNHIWSRVSKMVPVDKEVDLFYLFEREFLRYRGKVRADKVESERVDSFSATTSTYTCNEHTYHDIVTDRDRSLSDPIIDPDVRVTKNVSAIVDLDVEVDVATVIFGSSNYGANTSAPTNKWDITNPDGDPFGDIDSAKNTVQKAIGMAPNKMVIGKLVFDQLKRHPDVLEYFKYTGKPIVTTEMLAQAFGFEEVIVGESILVTSKQGQGTVTTDYIWGKFAAILYIPPEAAIEEPAFSYTFMHKLFGTLTAMVQRIPVPTKGKNAIQIEVTRSYTIKVTGQLAGYLYTAVVS